MADDEVIYVDLGLPSGRLWAKDYLRDDDGKIVRIYFDKAAAMGIPTRDDYVEMMTQCELGFFQDERRIICRLRGPSGKSLLLKCVSYDENHQITDFSYSFWLKDPDGKPLSCSLTDRVIRYDENVMVNAVVLVK